MVFPAGVKEIGFGPIILTEAGKLSPLRHLDGVPVLHWHGDTYALPAGALHLASTPQVEQQAFQIGYHVLGLQFHAETDATTGFERWLVGHAHELAAGKIDVAGLRKDARRDGHRVSEAGSRMFREWLAGLGRTV